MFVKPALSLGGRATYLGIMPVRTFALMLLLVIAAGGVTVAALAWLSVPAGALVVGLVAAAVAVRRAVRSR